MDSLLLLSCFLLCGQVFAIPSPTEHGKRAAVSPQVLGTPSIIANVTDPSVTRDSCGSVRIGNQEFWACRDTEPYDAATGQGVLPLFSNTCGWTSFTSSGTPNIVTNGPAGANSNGSNPILEMEGCDVESYPLLYPIASNKCPQAGACSDGTRWAIWPNSPPMVASTSSMGTTTAYTWIPNDHLSTLTLLNPEPSCALYKVVFNETEGTARPRSSLVHEYFWARHQICFGDYGHVVHDGVAYLYGQTDQGQGTTLAKVASHAVEDQSQYQYYVDGTWTSQMPSINDSAAIIPNAGAGGQGTFFYSKYFSSFVWIGQSNDGFNDINAEFFVSTAPAPEGPWIEPYSIYTGPNGNGLSYSLQAHPGLLKSSDQNGIYVTWTQSNDGGIYVTPLVYIEWQ